MNSKELFWLFKYYSFNSESISCPVVSDSATKTSLLKLISS